MVWATYHTKAMVLLWYGLLTILRLWYYYGRGYLPYYGDRLEQCDVHETDGGRVIVNDMEPVDAALGDSV